MNNDPSGAGTTAGAGPALALSTCAFAISFAVWGMIAPLAKTFQAELRLTEQQVWLLIASPVLLGSIMRLPMGMLADRYGGRIVFGGLLIFTALPAAMLSFAVTYRQLTFWAVVLGMAGASFSVGVAFTSKWFPASRQGFALGVYGSGNIGQSVALFAIPAVSAALGSWRVSYRIFALAALVYGAAFLLLARDAKRPREAKSARQMFRILAKQPMAWMLSACYFVTFGGFVALSIGLPKVLQELFHLTSGQAGLRVAGFVLVATLMRPIGGAVSDRIGGAKLLTAVFGGAALMACGMALKSVGPFTAGALGVAALAGLGNGAVFKLVPQFFPNDTGSVTGLVGAMGGLGGFFPPLLLGFIRTATGSYSLGFLLLSASCLACLALNVRAMRPAFSAIESAGAAAAV